MDIIKGATAELTYTDYQVNLKVKCRGQTGVHSLDYRSNTHVIAAIGNRSVIKFKELPFIELITSTSSDISYTVRAVHYSRDSESKPTDISSIALMPGNVEIVRSQLLNINRVQIRNTPNVTDLVKPSPEVGYSPRLDIAWTSLGTNSESEVVLVVHCVFIASGADLPAYQ